jgi:GrpB-like predicted nucleotidyltransferase (UPF0157 family)
VEAFLKPAVVVENYNSRWVEDFNSIRVLVWPQIHDVAIAIEHVGSTSVPRLSAKPIIDVDVVVASADKIPAVIERLEKIGYEHQGNLGIEGREAFKAPPGSIRQNFYVCVEGALALRNHLILRNHLRSNAESRRAYGELKQKLANEFANDIESYVEAKTELILIILSQYGISTSELTLIRNANLRSKC